MDWFLIIWFVGQTYVPPTQTGPYATKKDCEIAWTQIKAEGINSVANHVCAYRGAK